MKSDLLTVDFQKGTSKPSRERVLKRERIYSQDCPHNSGYTLIDGENIITCKKCEAVLDPIWVFTEMIKIENAWHAQYQRFVKFFDEYKKHSKFKCDHCGKMSRTVKNI